MSLQLERFAVLGLHNKFDVDIPIFDNKLILVGVNGLGKTTVVNLLYFLLTGQWSRLLETEFASIIVVLNEHHIEIARADIEHKVSLNDRYEKVLTRSAMRLPISAGTIRKIISHPAFTSLPDLSNDLKEKVARSLARDVEVPTGYVMRLLADLPKGIVDDLFETTKDSPAIAHFLSIIKEAANHKVIYLPTYRRIEQDLKAIFPALDDDELRKLTSRSLAGGPRNRGHVELVHFGMQDVEKRIQEELEAIRERTRSQLSNLTASYLKDIIRNRADVIETEALQEIDDEVVAAILQRVEENTLSIEDKREIASSIQRIRAGESNFQARDKYLAYFFSRLLEIYVGLGLSEENIRNLVQTSNRYLERKSLVYNNVAFTANIHDADGTALDWKVLSSGEKQVVSLFTHLFLTPDAEQTVIIDEPELSLSVQWQKRLLPDIANSASCKLLIAVTHSPFVFANELDVYAVDLAKCIRPTSTQD